MRSGNQTVTKHAMSAGWRGLALYLALISMATFLVGGATRPEQADNRQTAGVVDRNPASVVAPGDERSVPLFWHDRP